MRAHIKETQRVLPGPGLRKEPIDNSKELIKELITLITESNANKVRVNSNVIIIQKNINVIMHQRQIHIY